MGVTHSRSSILQLKKMYTIFQGHINFSKHKITQASLHRTKMRVTDLESVQNTNKQEK